MGRYGFNMMNGYGFGMMEFGLLMWLINLFTIGVVVYFAIKLALKKYNLNHDRTNDPK